MQIFARPRDTATKQLWSIGGLVASILLSLLVGLAYLLRSVRDAELSVSLRLKRADGRKGLNLFG